PGTRATARAVRTSGVSLRWPAPRVGGRKLSQGAGPQGQRFGGFAVGSDEVGPVVEEAEEGGPGVGEEPGRLVLVRPAELLDEVPDLDEPVLPQLDPAACGRVGHAASRSQSSTG